MNNEQAFTVGQAGVALATLVWMVSRRACRNFRAACLAPTPWAAAAMMGDLVFVVPSKL